MDSTMRADGSQRLRIELLKLSRTECLTMPLVYETLMAISRKVGLGSVNPHKDSFWKQ